MRGPFLKTPWNYTDRPTGAPAGTSNQSAILWFKAETGGQLVVKEAISNNTLIAEGYFGGLWFGAVNPTAFAAEHTETKIDIQKGVDHLTFQGDSLYGLPGVKTETRILSISATEKVNTPINVHIHIGGITDNNFSYGPWGRGFTLSAKSGTTEGDAVITVDAMDDNQFTNSYEKDPATGDFINRGGGAFFYWWFSNPHVTVTFGSFQNNSFHLNNSATVESGRSEVFVVRTGTGNSIVVQNARGNEVTSLGPYRWSAKFFIQGGTLNLGADFRTDNPNFLTKLVHRGVQFGGVLIW